MLVYNNFVNKIRILIILWDNINFKIIYILWDNYIYLKIFIYWINNFQKINDFFNFKEFNKIGGVKYSEFYSQSNNIVNYYLNYNIYYIIYIYSI